MVSVEDAEYRGKRESLMWLLGIFIGIFFGAAIFSFFFIPNQIWFAVFFVLTLLVIIISTYVDTHKELMG